MLIPIKQPQTTLFVVLLFIIAACTPATPEPTITPIPEPTATPAPVIESVCLVTDIGSIDDGTFNQYAYEGMLVAAEEFTLDEPQFIETQSSDDYLNNINQCIEDGANIVITVGFLIQGATIETARDNPGTYFIGIDQSMEGVENPPDNAVGVQFREDQSGFLVGVLAALVANEQDSDVIAGVYGIDVPAVVRFRNGFEQGALLINPDWEVGTNILGRYHDSFDNTEDGITAAEDFIEAGASVIFGAGGPLGSAGVTHAAQQGVYGIGVDQDEYFTTFQSGELEGSEFLISSALKRVDQGVIDMVGVLSEGRFQDFPGGQNYLLDATLGGVGFAEAHDAEIPEDIRRQVSQTLQGLVSGEISTGVDPDTGELLDTESDE